MKTNLFFYRKYLKLFMFLKLLFNDRETSRDSGPEF